MRSLPWQKIILSILFLTILIGLTGCQSDSKLVQDLKNTIDAFAQIPAHLAKAVVNLMGSIGDIGGALGEQIKNIIQGMTGR